MTTLTKIELQRNPFEAIGTELILSWDNDRHQAVDLKQLTPDDVIAGLEQLVMHLKRERYYGNI